MSSMTGYNVGQTSTGKWAGDKIPSGYKIGTLQQFTPEQLNLFQSLFAHAAPNSYLSRLAGGDQSFFAEQEAPALRQFAGLQGNIASRFSGGGLGYGGGGRGAMSARRSSGFQNATNQAATDFAQQLQSQRQGLQRQAIQDLMGISGQLLGQRPYERRFTPKPDSFLEQLALGAAPNLISSLLGGF